MHGPIRPNPNIAVHRAGYGFALLLLGGVLIVGCRPEANATDADSHVAVDFNPSPPSAAITGLKITLTDSAGQPLRLGHLEVEANMNHAGMKPVFAHLEENKPGCYEGAIEFTMGGDWFLLLSGQQPAGSRFEKKVDVPGVKPK